MSLYWGPFHVVQPWGRDKARESTILSNHATAEAAFAEIDRLAEERASRGAPSDDIELLVVDQERRIVPRRDVH